jgi:hypothetical protein
MSHQTRLACRLHLPHRGDTLADGESGARGNGHRYAVLEHHGRRGVVQFPEV